MRRLEVVVGVTGLVLPVIVFGGAVLMAVSRAQLPGLPAHFARFLPMYLMLVWAGANLFYAWHAYFSGKVPKDKRALWVALLLAANYFVMPFYFWWYIWPQEALNRSHTLHEAV